MQNGSASPLATVGGAHGKDHHLHGPVLQEDLYSVWGVQQREGSAAERHVSILWRSQRGKVANGLGIHNHPEKAKYLNANVSDGVEALRWMNTSSAAHIAFCEDDFRPVLTRAEGWFVCEKCCHTVIPEDPEFECSCKICRELNRAA